MTPAAAQTSAPAAVTADPSRPIRMIVPFSAGDATDILARALSQKLGEKIGQSVVIDNRPGAGGTLGADAASKAAPDGYLGIYGPKGMGADLAGRVNQAVNAALADADVKERFARLGAEPTCGTSQAFAAMVKADNAKWKKIISERKITAE